MAEVTTYRPLVLRTAIDSALKTHLVVWNGHRILAEKRPVDLVAANVDLTLNASSRLLWVWNGAMQLVSCFCATKIL